MAQGHILDANTFALWKLNETGRDPNAFADLGTNPVVLSQTNAPNVVMAPGGAYARHFTTNQYLTGAGNSTDQLELVGEWAIEAWVWVDALTGVNQWVLTYTDPIDDSSETKNYLATLYIKESDRRLGTFWEHGVGINVDVLQTAGAQVALQTWTHVAVRKRLVLGIAEVDFFIGGVLQQTITGLTNATGGTNATVAWYLGTQQGATNAFNGSIHEVRVSRTAISDGDIATSAAASDHRHTIISDTLHLWRLDEQPDVVDASPNNRHLSLRQGNVLGVADAIIGDTSIGHGAAWFDGAASVLCRDVDNAAWVSLFLGEWTFEGWFVHGDEELAEQRFVAFTNFSRSGTAAADNYLMFSSFAFSSSNYFARGVWEQGSGVDVNFQCTTALQTGRIDYFTPFHYAFRKRSNGSGLYFMDFFKNGVLVQSSTALANATGGTNGAFYLGGDASVAKFHGWMDDVRLSNMARSDAEILASYQRGSNNLPNPLLLVIGGL